MNYLSPVENVENVDYIYLLLLHPLFAVLCKSYATLAFLGNLPDAAFDFLYIYYRHPLPKIKRKS
jgi:hypothetical protein